MAKHNASERLWALPAPSAAELATKLKIFQEADGWDLNCAGEVIDRITADARRFGHHGAFVQPDRALLSAYRGCCTETKWLSAHPDRTTEQEEPCLERRAEFEQAVAETPATSLEGVVAKLRLGFGSAQLDAWREDAIIAPKSVRFKEGLRMGCMFDRTIWSAIEDLARIGGIDLSEQGA